MKPLNARAFVLSVRQQSSEISFLIHVLTEISASLTD